MDVKPLLLSYEIHPALLAQSRIFSYITECPAKVPVDAWLKRWLRSRFRRTALRRLGHHCGGEAEHSRGRGRALVLPLLRMTRRSFLGDRYPSSVRIQAALNRRAK